MKPGVRIAFTIAILAVVQIAAQSVAIGWSIALASAVGIAGLVLLALRWRSRPLSRSATDFRAAAAPELLVGSTGFAYRRKWTILPLIGLSTVTAGAAWITWAAATDPTVTGWTRGLPALFAVGGLFTGWWSFVMALRLVRRRPGLYVDASGLLDATNGIAYHRILWQEIATLRWKERSGSYGIGRYPYVAVQLAHAELFLARQGGWRRLLVFWRWKTSADPVKINVAMLDVAPNELEEAVRRHSAGHVRFVD